MSFVDKLLQQVDKLLQQASEIDQPEPAAPSRFATFTKDELDDLWDALFHYRERMQGRNKMGRQNPKRSECFTALIDELYRSPNWSK